MPVAVPLIMAGVSAATAAYGAKKARDAQKPAMAAQTMLANQQAAQGAQMFSIGAPLAQGAGTYYQRLLSGSRATMRQAVAPEAAEITDLYKGAERGLSRSNVTGASRDYAMGELARERAGRVAQLIPMARRAAAGEAGNLGATLSGMGSNATGQAGSAFGNMLHGQQQQNRYDDQQRYQFGQNLGGLFTDVYKAWGQRGGGGGGSALSGM